MSRPRILVVEDEFIVARDLQRQLLELGYEPVGHARRGEDAIVLAGQLRPDLVLMDIQLADGLDGIAAAQAIRAQFALPVVFLTAFAADDTLDRAKLTEPFGYILKPFSERELRTVLVMALYKAEADAKLRQSEARHRAVTQSARDAIITADSAGAIVGWNQGAETIFGYTDAEILGAPLTGLIPERYRDGHLTGVGRMLASGALPASSQAELAGLRKDRSEFPLELSVARWEGIDGRFVTVFVRDITERKQFEIDFLQSQKLAALGVMAGGIAHEIGNPLSICSSSAQFLLEERVSPAFRRACAEKILKAVQRASSIIQSLLRYAHPAAPSERARVDLSSIIQDTLLLVDAPLKFHGIDTDVALPTESIPVMGVATLLQQVFMNLFLNAIHAMPDGGRLTIRVGAANAEASVQIADTGCGIFRQVIDKIFDPFYTTSTVGKGTGLGLAICYSIVTQHGGAIVAESTEGMGSTFTVTLPLSTT